MNDHNDRKANLVTSFQTNIKRYYRTAFRNNLALLTALERTEAQFLRDIKSLGYDTSAKMLNRYRNDCETTSMMPLCLLEAYWGIPLPVLISSDFTLLDTREAKALIKEYNSALI